MAPHRHASTRREAESPSASPKDERVLGSLVAAALLERGQLALLPLVAQKAGLGREHVVGVAVRV